MAEFSTFQRPYSSDKIKFLLEIAKGNIRSNKDTLTEEIKKAAKKAAKVSHK